MDKRYKPSAAQTQLAERIALYADLKSQSESGQLMGAAGVGAAVRQLRSALRLTVQELSQMTKISPRSITQIETGAGNPTLATVQALLSPMGLQLSVKVP